MPRPGPERVLAEDVREALRLSQVSFSHEAPLSRGRVDLRAGSTAIELKVRGSATSVLKQLARYSEDPTVETVVLATTSRKIALAMPAMLGSKPLHVVYLARL